MSTEGFDKRFGVTAVDNEIITFEQLFEALKIQVIEELESSKHRLIGEILREKEYITAGQVDEVLILMGIL
jgi:hypothetical protein